MSWKSFFTKQKKQDLDQGLEKTKKSFFSKIASTVAGKSKVDEEVLDDLEEVLVSSDVSVKTTLKIIKRLEERVKNEKYVGINQLSNLLKDEISEMLSENNIENILLKVKLDQFVDGRDIDLIEIGERSSKISGGEKQRIALARALYKNNSVLVFDEATNALDKKTEAEIFKIIYELSNITTFIITHDIQNLYGCDRIYELKNETLNQVDII